MTEQQKKAASDLLAGIRQQKKSAARHFFLLDLWERLRSTPLYAHWQRLLTWTRRFRAVTLTLRIFSFLFATLQAGTLVLLSATLLLAVLPLLLTGTLLLLLSAALSSRRSNRQLSKKLEQKSVYVLFPGDTNSRFLAQHVKDLHTRGYAVILVSPYLFSPVGLRTGRFYTTVREELDGVYLVRRYYYFSCKRSVLARLKVIYQF